MGMPASMAAAPVRMWPDDGVRSGVKSNEATGPSPVHTLHASIEAGLGSHAGAGRERAKSLPLSRLALLATLGVCAWAPLLASVVLIAR